MDKIIDDKLARQKKVNAHTPSQIETSKKFDCKPCQVFCNSSLDTVFSAEYYSGNLKFCNICDSDNIWQDKLIAIDGNLIFENCNISAITNLKKVTGTIIIKNSKIRFINNIQNLDGDLVIHNSEVLSFHNLNNIYGNVTLTNSKVMNFRTLENIKKNLVLQNSCIAFAPKLKTIGKNLVLINSNIEYNSPPKVQEKTVVYDKSGNVIFRSGTKELTK